MKTDQTLQPQDLERVLRRPDLDGYPGRRRVHQVCRLQGREGILHQQSRRGDREGHAREHGTRRLSHGRQRRHLPDAERKAGLDQRQEAHVAPSSRRATACCSISATISAISTIRYRGSEADRLKAFEANRARWGREWLMLANPSYGSFDTAAYGHDFKKPRDEQRKAKYDVLEGWPGPN